MTGSFFSTGAFVTASLGHVGPIRLSHRAPTVRVMTVETGGIGGWRVVCVTADSHPGSMKMAGSSIHVSQASACAWGCSPFAVAPTSSAILHDAGKRRHQPVRLSSRPRIAVNPRPP